MTNMKGLEIELKRLGFETIIENRNMKAFRKSFHVDQPISELGAVWCEIWTDFHEVIIRPGEFGFQVKLLQHDMVLTPF